MSEEQSVLRWGGSSTIVGEPDDIDPAQLKPGLFCSRLPRSIGFLGRGNVHTE